MIVASMLISHRVWQKEQAQLEGISAMIRANIDPMATRWSSKIVVVIAIEVLDAEIARAAGIVLVATGVIDDHVVAGIYFGAGS